MDDLALADLYFRTTLELRDDEGRAWRISPTDTAGSATDPLVVLSPFTDAFILTAENPESSGAASAQENARATAELAHLLSESSVTYRECPGFAWDADHVEPGFAILAGPSRRDELEAFALELALRFRQNAIFHLDQSGLGIIGALRTELTGHTPVVCERF